MSNNKAPSRNASGFRWRALARAPRLLLVGFLAAALHIVLNFPMVLHLTDSLPGTVTDNVSFFAQVWYLDHNLFQGHDNWAYTHMYFYPTGSLFGVRPLLFWWTLVGEVGGLFYNNLLFWYNVCMILSAVATAMGMWVLSFRLTRRTSAALLGALVFTFCGRRGDTMQAHMNYYSTEFFVWTLVAIQAGLRRGGGVRPWVAAGVMWGMQIWQSPDMALFLGFCWGPLVCWYWWREWVDYRRKRPTGRVWWAPFTSPLITILATIPLLIAVYPYLGLELFSGGVPWPYTHWYEFIYPSSRHHIYAPISHFLARYRSLEHFEAFLGYGAILGGFFFLFSKAWRMKRMLPWLLLSAVALTLTLGTQFQILHGRITIPLPYKIILELPVVKELRVPSRFNGVFMLGLSLMAAMGWSVLRARRFPFSKTIYCVILALALLDGCFVPVTMTNMRHDPRRFPPRLLERIKSDPDSEISVLNVPTRIPNYISQAQQMIHLHPTYDGFETRWQRAQFDQIRLGPLLYLSTDSKELNAWQLDQILRDGEQLMKAVDERMSVGEFRKAIAPARLKYLLVDEYQNPFAPAERKIIRKYFEVQREDREGDWLLLTVKVEPAKRKLLQSTER